MARLYQPPLLTDNNLQSCLLHYITAASIWNSNYTLDRVSLWNLHNWGKSLLKLQMHQFMYRNIFWICSLFWKYIMISLGYTYYEKFQMRLHKWFDHILWWLVNIFQHCFEISFYFFGCVSQKIINCPFVLFFWFYKCSPTWLFLPHLCFMKIY